MKSPLGKTYNDKFVLLIKQNHLKQQLTQNLQRLTIT